MDLFSAVLITKWLHIREPHKNLCSNADRSVSMDLKTAGLFNLVHRSLSTPSLLTLSVSSFSTKHNGSTNGSRRGGRPSRLPNVLKVKSRAWHVGVCLVPVAGQIKQLSIIPRWEQTNRLDGPLILLSSPRLSSPLLASPLLASPLLASPLLASPLLASPRHMSSPF